MTVRATSLVTGESDAMHLSVSTAKLQQQTSRWHDTLLHQVMYRSLGV